MGLRIFILTTVLMTCNIVFADNYICTEQERDVYLSDSAQILSETEFAAQEMIVRWKKRYVIPRDKIQEFEHYVKNCEFRKVCQNHLYTDSLRLRVENKMATEDMFRDSIYTLLIPVCQNKISGENLCLTLKLAKSLELDSVQYTYLMDKAIDMAHRMDRSRTLNTWNEEIDLLRKTLTEKQLSIYFTKKNAQSVKKEVEIGWRILEDANLTEELDSVKDRLNAARYYQERQKIKDIYRYYGTSQKRCLTELNKHMPKMVLMLDALDKKKRIKEKNGNIGKEFAW